MPHYADGTPAQIGDRVRGKGYNVKGKDGEPAEFEGIVVGVTPGASSCNIKVAFLRAVSVSKTPDTQLPGPTGFSCYNGQRAMLIEEGVVAIDTEYGQCDAFRKVGT